MGNAGLLPRKEWETTAATTLATTTDGNAPTDSEPRISSNAKNAPASGALNAAEMPAAAPAATMTLVRAGSNLNARPRNEASAAPSTATGPSLPAAPPLPSVTALAAVRASVGWSGSLPPSRATARCTSGTLRPSCPRPAARMMRYASGEPDAGEQRPVGEDTRLRQEDRGTEIEEPVREIDQPVEQHHGQPAHQADGHGEAKQDAVLIEVEGIEPVGEAVPDAARLAGGEPGRVAGRSRRIRQERKFGHAYLRKHCMNRRLTSVFASVTSPFSTKRITSDQRSVCSSMNSSASRCSAPDSNPTAMKR